jgi:hypothetical protein
MVLTKSLDNRHFLWHVIAKSALFAGWPAQSAAKGSNPCSFEGLLRRAKPALLAATSDFVKALRNNPLSIDF